MNHKKVTKLIKKINNLHQSFLEDDDTITNIEKELLLSYIENLYNIVGDGVELIQKKVDSEKIISNKKITADKELPLQEQASQNVIIQELEAVVETPILKEVDKTKIEEQLKEKEIVVEPVVVKSSKLEKIEEVVPEVSIKQPIKDTVAYSDEMMVLFEPIEVKELSAKLANSPIKSIKSKLAINEKLLTVKELFSKDQEAFNTAIATLDGFNSFEEAQSYLAENIVNKFEWLSEKKVKKAIRFIQLVQRRYL